VEAQGGGTSTPKTAPAQPRWAGPSEGWYAVSQFEQQCKAQEMGPADVMALLDQRGEQYRMEDVTEQGQVVQTTMYRVTEGVQATWYKGKARCEQALRKKQQSQEQQREKYR
jgi:hypothetical protein